jgi:hypothetical protein
VNVKATVSSGADKSDKLRLQIALVEDQVHYSGENGLRFHEMVVRSLAAVSTVTAGSSAAADKPAAAPAAADKPAAAPRQRTSGRGGKPRSRRPTGFGASPGKGGSFSMRFDLAQAAAAAKAHLEDYEKTARKGEYKFRQKKDEIDASNLSVVAFVQDEATKKILQAVYMKLPGGKPAN